MINAFHREPGNNQKGTFHFIFTMKFAWVITHDLKLVINFVEDTNQVRDQFFSGFKNILSDTRSFPMWLSKLHRSLLMATLSSKIRPYGSRPITTNIWWIPSWWTWFIRLNFHCHKTRTFLMICLCWTFSSQWWRSEVKRAVLESSVFFEWGNVCRTRA